MDYYDYRALRELLYSWDLLDLFQHFKDEGVNIEEMKIMKYHHVQELLQNFKLGTRIRFDYHYERWRRNLQKPLQIPCTSSHLLPAPTCYTSCQTHTTHEDIKPMQLQRPSLKRRKSRTPSMESNDLLDVEVSMANPSSSPTPSSASPVVQAPSQQQQQQQQQQQPQLQAQAQSLPPPPAAATPPASSTAVLTASSTASLPTAPSDLPKEMPKLTPQPKRFASDNGTERPHASPPSTALIADTLRMNCVGGDPLRALHFYDSMDKTATLSVMRILQSSGRKGLEILDFYHKHHELKNSHRWLLINLIVNFFDDNNLHLSLNMSHHLENQILELFPTEKLENYRTEKRGRIYVKFSNMKRYQRERAGGIKRKWNKSIAPLMDKDVEVEIVDGNAEDDNCSLTLENWAPALPNALEEDGDTQIKTEVIMGDDYI